MCETPGNTEDVVLSLAAAGDVVVTDLSFTLQRNCEVLALCLEELQMVRKA